MVVERCLYEAFRDFAASFFDPLKQIPCEKIRFLNLSFARQEKEINQFSTEWFLPGDEVLRPTFFIIPSYDE